MQLPAFSPRDTPVPYLVDNVGDASDHEELLVGILRGQVGSLRRGVGLGFSSSSSIDHWFV